MAIDEPKSEADGPDSGRSTGPPIHPLAALLLLVVDNLWNLGDWAVFAWVLIIPLTFLSVLFPGVFLQRFANHDGWGKSIAKGLLLAFLAAVPTSIAGTPVGVAFLAWAGVDRWRSRERGALAEFDTGSVVTSPPKPARGEPVTLDIPSESVPQQSPAQPHPAPEAHYSFPPPRKASRAGVIALCLLLVALCFTTGIVLLKFASDKIELIAGKVANLPGLFRRPPLDSVFTSSLPELSRTVGGKLEIASFKITESFERIDSEDFLVPLGETKSRIRVPVTYTYSIDLHSPWTIEVTNGICHITAPAIQHGVPAIHTGGMVKDVQSDFLTRLKPGLDPRQRLDEFEKTLTARLWVNAGSAKYHALVREECRKTVGEFVRDWILKDERYKTYDVETLKIIFPDEVGKEEARSLPTLIVRKN
jgi:hypothetical protein